MNRKNLRQLIISSATYSLSSILGPLLFFGIPAYFLDQFFGSKPFILLTAVFISFITTNILLYKKVAKINQLISAQSPKETEEKQD